MLTPKERNRIRQIRDLLTLYENHEASRPSALINLSRAVTELSAAHVESHSERAVETLKQLKKRLP